MFIKLKGEEHYHFCREHIEELGRLGELDTPGQLSGRQYSRPEDREICKECQTLAKKGHCTPPYAEVGSYTHTD